MGLVVQACGRSYLEAETGGSEIHSQPERPRPCFKIKIQRGWRCSLAVEHLPNIIAVLLPISSAQGNKGVKGELFSLKTTSQCSLAGLSGNQAGHELTDPSVSALLPVLGLKAVPLCPAKVDLSLATMPALGIYYSV